MKNHLGLITLLFFAIALYGSSDALSAQNDDSDDVDRAWKGSPNTRTWVVTEVPNPEFEMKIGDAFRMEKSGYVTRFFPLATLQKSWDIEDGVSIDLEKTKGGSRKFCGKLDKGRFAAETKTQRYIIFYPPGNGHRSYEMHIDIIQNESGIPCEDLEIHGGMAHAQN